MSGLHKIVLIDEPEVFFHPPRNRSLGQTMSEICTERDGNMIVATHSADIVLGLIQSSDQVNIIRLTYNNGKATACSLRADEVKHLMQTPLMRSTGAINAVFHTGTIVCESAGDRVFLEEVNRQLLIEDGEKAEKDKRGIGDLLILDAFSNSSIHILVKYLRKMGLPTAAIADFDSIIGDPFKTLLTACNVPMSEKSRIYASRDIMQQNICALEPNAKKQYKFFKENGISKLTGSQLGEAVKLLDELGEYGLFFNPYGEIESWLSGKAPAKTNRMTTAAWVHQLLIELESNDSIMTPEEGDVWEFVGKITKWISNENKNEL